jgi:hypothetical protein
MRRAVLVVLFAVLCPGLARAQITRHYWGVSGAFAPEWKVPSSFQVLFDADDVTFTGSELQIGVVRGGVAKGEWGVSFVRKNVDDESEVRRQVGVECPGCGTILTMRSTKLSGVRRHW